MLSPQHGISATEHEAQPLARPSLTADALRNAVADLLGCEARDLLDTDDLAELGMDSIRTMTLAGWLRRQGVQVGFPALAQSPTLAQWSALADAHLPEPRARSAAVAEAGPAVDGSGQPVDPGAPFALTPMQHAYWIGRRDDQVLGSVGCHAYLEFDGVGLVPERLEAAVRTVLARHGMLRARFLEDGTQQIMPDSAWPGLLVHDLRDGPEQHVAGRLEQHTAERLAAVREALSHRRLRVEQGEVLDVQLSLLPGGATRLHLGVDLLVADVESIRILLADLTRAYHSPELLSPTEEFTFPHYLADHGARRAQARREAQAYWRDRLPDLPDGPGLPLATDPTRLAAAPRFTRRRHRLEPDAWRRFGDRARRGGTTPAMALAAAYAEVLGAFSESPRFLLSVPLFDRDAVHPAVPGMVADFTDLLLLTADVSADVSFLERARALQSEFRAVAAHSAYSGVDVLRDLARARETGEEQPRRAPVVFACTLGDDLIDAEVRQSIGELGWMISQTPQVWLDHQVYESQGGVDLCWDAVDDLFPAGLVDDMFDSYRELVDRLAAGRAWDGPVRPALPPRQRAVRARVNATGAPGADRPLHAGFFDRAAEHPDSPALLWGDDDAAPDATTAHGTTAHGTTTYGRMTYGTLARRALGVAAALRERGLRAAEPVAVSTARGADQIAAVLGVLAAGGSYVPVGVDQPDRRRRRILERAGVRLLLTDTAAPTGLPSTVSALDVATACAHPPLAGPVPVPADAPAYVIFTSGTTGDPKGVQVAHGAAANTVADLNERFSVGPRDRVLAVSALDFDLSVYDVFGLLSAGGALVLPAEAQRRDPRAWAELIARHGVTVWNSVPVLLDMLLTAAPVEPQLPGGLAGLRLALLSGDWIGLDLPGRLAGRSGQACRFVALGGATEASIWSNLFEVTEVPATWTSVPYGFPLRNQQFRVVGPTGLDRPDWVAGELWIGGAGVALGYLGDPGLTADRFVTHEDGRWYRTGDRGRYWPDGTLEFLGRIDRQIKIRGVRTELGEIEAALQAHPSVGRCTVAVLGEGPARRLAAVATPVAVDGRPARPALPPVPAPRAVAVAEPAPESAGPAGPRDQAGPAAPRDQAGPAAPRDQAGPVAPRDQADPEARVVEHVLARLAAGEAGVTAASAPLTELARRWGAPPGWQPLLRLWFDWLAARGVLTGDRHGYAAGPRLAAVCRPAASEAPPGGELTAVAQRLAQRIDELAAVVRGELDPSALLDDPVLAPEALAGLDAGADRAAAALVAELPSTAIPLEIAVLGAGGSRIARRLAAADDRHRCTLLDTSVSRLDAAQKLLADAPGRFAYRRLSGPLVPAELLGRFDVVVADNALHAYPDPAQGAQLGALLLAPGGLLLALERTALPPLALIAAALPTVGFTRLDPVRRDRRTPLLPAVDWHHLLARAGLVPSPARAGGPALPDGHLLLRAAKAPDAGLPTEDALREWLAARLPAAMIPDLLFGTAALPLTANGKVDRAALAGLLPAADPAGAGAGAARAAGDPPSGPLETALAALWCEVLGVGYVAREQSFFALGGDSLLATRLVSRLRGAGLAVELSAVFASPVLKDLAACLTHAPGAPHATVVADPGHRHDPFPPTDVQRAYWTGRAAGLPLGGVGAHYYVEFDGTGLDLDRLEEAWNRLIARHEMLRAVFDEHGDQRILADVPRVVIPVERPTADAAGDALGAFRTAMSHQVRDPARWPLVDLRALVYEQDGARRVRLGVSLENIVLDGRSMMIVLGELDRLYRTPDAALPPVDGLSFRDYLLQVAPSAAASEAARRYWTDRLADLPPAPRLPLAAHPSEVTAARFVRRSGLLPTARWQALTDRARTYGLTPSAVLLAGYAEVLGRWSAHPELTVNLTLFDREEVHPAVDDIVGDFTSLLLVAYQPAPGAGFLDRARALQRRLGEDLGHRAWSAVRVTRELARSQGVAEQAMPVVFTSALGTPRDLSLDLADWLLPRVWGVSQTPQTWLDNQVYDSARGLHYDWDAVEQLFPAGALDAMFAAYGELLGWLAESDWDAPVPDLLPAGQRAVRAGVNSTAGPLPTAALHEPFFALAEREPDRTACHWAGGRLDYGQLALRARRIAALLRANGVRPGCAVALHLPKGPDQLAAVLGVLATGAAYVPVGVDLPVTRRERLYRNAGVHCVLTATAHAEPAPEGVAVLAIGEYERYEPLAGPVAVAGDALAYVIFTSGSTGEPKGVEVSHRAAANTVQDVNERFAVGPDDRVLAVSALDFDLSVYDIFGPLSTGAALVLIGEDERRDAERWLDLAHRHRVTLWNTVPTLLDMLLTAAESRPLPDSLRLALVSGDWVGLDLHPRLTTRLPHCRLIALGGATEAAIWSNSWEITGIPAHWTSVPYGHPLRNQCYRVVDAQGRDCPDLVPGELWIGGLGLADGYRGDPDRTAEKFVQHDGTGWYRTGDLGRYHGDGTLEFLGRTDHQLKINGHRLEPGEIEAALESHPGVRRAVVTVDDRGARRQLVAHVVAEGGHQVAAEVLRAFLAERLPRHAVPHAVAFWDELPLTANGKVDRAALTAHAVPAQVPSLASQLPETPAELLVAAVWSEVLGVPAPSCDGNFFTLGGDSLLATKVVTRLRTAGVAGAAISALFTAPQLAEFAATLTLEGEPSAVGVRPAGITADPAARHQPFPPTELQRAYWVGRSSAFTLGGVGSYYYCEFDASELDLARLEDAWNRLIERHEMLRVVFDEDGSQRVMPVVPRLTIPLAEATGETRLTALREEMSHQLLDPSTWPLFDVRAARHEDGRTRVGIGLDYLVVDGLSMMILFSELDRLYRDPDAQLPPIGVSFRDYACQVAPDPTELDRSLSYWQQRIPQLPPAPALPLAVDPATVDRPRFVRRETWLAPEQWQALQARARQHGFTPSALLLACYAEVLGAWSLDPELTLALTLFDRRDVHPDIERVLGDFTSLLPVAHRPEPGESFEARVRRLQDRLWRDLDHRGAPVLGLLRAEAGAAGAAGATLPVVFTSALGVADELSDGLRRPVWSVSQTPQVWLDEQVMVRDGGLLVTWDAVEELFPAGMLDAMFAAHGDLLDWACRADWSAPRPALLPVAQRAVRAAVNATAGPLPSGPLHGDFFARAAADPGRCALRWGADGRLTYGELAERALRIAALLHAGGLRPAEPVAVSLPKGPDQIAAVLGVLAAGGAYLPIGPEQPGARRARMLATGGARFTLSAAEVAAAPAYEPLAGPVAVAGDALAYVIFTSGSTGEPKGVEITHRAALNTVQDINERFTVGPDDRLLALSALDFDLSVYDIFGPLSTGAALVLPHEDDRRNPEAWLTLIDDHRVTLWNSVPTLLDMLLTAARPHQPLTHLRLALVSGDWVGLDLHPRLTSHLPHCRLIALGGATEAAIWSNSWEVTGIPAHWTSIPYGHPLRNQHHRTTGPHGHDTPDWVPGELWIAGAGLAAGYRGDPTRTVEKFVRHDGVRYYRTGDLARYHPDGTLEFLGRTDHQLKINGHRLEPGETEAALTAYPAVRQAVVVAVGERGGHRLHAFVTADGPEHPQPAAVQGFLVDRLPPYARPSTITVLDALPLTGNGKVDRAKLKSLASEAGSTPPTGQAARGPVETTLAELWGGLLGRAAVPRDATFFALGGDSLQATRLVQRLRDRFGCEISLRQLLSTPTIAGLATLIEHQILGTEDDDTEDGSL
ncbi:non-ribosomal peptide synthetase [Kitasatospora mediocidica]|uniref:non-ribosomal peptide synthetase n=1 Tax=Kitasatospora mediocidica TaxID=58352 RepID=UPI00069059AC|nr:non-ribosomal peptide synthetase [Kitasatospora mediocidica]